MSFPQLKITYIGGPTALLEFGGMRLLTDPESRDDIDRAFKTAGLESRLRWLEPGRETVIDMVVDREPHNGLRRTA
jgi:hypothetical protein